MNKSKPRASHSASRKSPARSVASKTARRSSLKVKSKVAVTPRSKARKPVAALKSRTGLAAAAHRAKRFVSRMKRQVSSALSSR